MRVVPRRLEERENAGRHQRAAFEHPGPRSRTSIIVSLPVVLITDNAIEGNLRRRRHTADRSTDCSKPCK